MTKNDAYKYAKKWWKKNPHGTYFELESQMKSEGYSDDEYSMVKNWLNTWAGGKRGWSK
jgi:hypothetical protein